MGYTLTIGEASLAWSKDSVEVDVEGVRLDDAPAFGEPTDYTNSRWPSYSSWFNAMDELGLVQVMFNEKSGGGGFEWNGENYEPLIVQHPGVAPITSAHLAYIEQKVSEYKAKHPDHVAKYPPPKEGAKPVIGTIYDEKDLVEDKRYDGNLCRAEWLLYWIRWALANCKYPTFYNS